MDSGFTFQRQFDQAHFTGAPALQLDFQADALEVVQASQDFNNSVPLVANKDTYVRAYAHLATNTTGTYVFYPYAALHGLLNGVEFPDSPIESLNPIAINANMRPRTRTSCVRS